jgi:hypothetical protein
VASTVEPNGTSRLLSDSRLAFGLGNLARHRALRRVFGTPEAEDNLVTLIALALLATAVRQSLRRVTLRRGDWLLGSAALREGLGAVAGPDSREPQVSTLIMAAVVARRASPEFIKSLLGAPMHSMVGGFRHRYGYLVDPGHWRARNAQRRKARAESGA